MIERCHEILLLFFGEIPVPGAYVAARRDDLSRGVIIAVIDEEVTVLWSVLPREDVKFTNFTTFSMPLVRRAPASILTSEIIGVQPMVLPSTGSIFYF